MALTDTTIRQKARPQVKAFSDILPGRKKRNYPRLDAKDLPTLLHDMDSYTGGDPCMSLAIMTRIWSGSAQRQYLQSAPPHPGWLCGC